MIMATGMSKEQSIEISKMTPFDVHHAFITWLQCEVPNVSFYRQHEHIAMNFSFAF